jgi:predicted nicotinamide N-methyase
VSLAPVPFVPEVRLHQSGDLYELWHQTERELGRAGLPPPFWGVPWPGGQALARYLLDHRAIVAGRSVLDFGSGSGLLAIAAAAAGAASVTAAETDPLAVAAIGLNAAANGVPAPACVTDARTALAGAEVVLAGDVWYERDLADHAAAFLAEASAGGALVLTGDISRRYFPRGRYECVASYLVPARRELEGKDYLDAAVWRC